MSVSRIAASLGVFVLVNLLAARACGEVLISYESEDDANPLTPDIIDVLPGQTATITIMLTALDGEADFGSGGFIFAGTPVGEGEDTVVVNGPLTVSHFMFADSMQDSGAWFTVNDLPDPAAVSFFALAALPLPVTLATFDVALSKYEPFVQDTGAFNFTDGNVIPFTLAEGSGSFTVQWVVPEPATAGMLIVGMMLLARRRVVGRVSPAVRKD